MQTLHPKHARLHEPPRLLPSMLLPHTQGCPRSLPSCLLSGRYPGAHCSALSNPLITHLLRVYRVHGARHWRQSGHVSRLSERGDQVTEGERAGQRLQCNPVDILEAL